MKNPLRMLLVLALSIGLTGCDQCENEVSDTVISPSGKVKAVVFNRACGSTTGFNTQISIIPVSQSLPAEAGNSLILDGTVPLKIEWESDSKLRIIGANAAKIFLRSYSTAGVSISYGAKS